MLHKIGILSQSVDTLVAMPGRLLDRLDQDNVDFSGLEILVLDKADRILGMGFLPDIKRIINLAPRNV